MNLEEVFLSRTPMLKSCPGFLRGRFRHCFCVASRERYRAKLAGDAVAEERAWKLFGLIPVMLLHRPQGCGSVGKQELAERANKFGRGQWRELLASSQEVPKKIHRPRTSRTSSLNRNDEVVPACNRVQQRQVSRARQELLGATLAPKTRETLAELQGRKKAAREGSGEFRRR